MRRLHPNAPDRAAGFSLIEVLIALVILSVGTLGIAAMMAVSVKSKNSAYSRAQANDLAYTILDRMRANRATAAQHGYDIELSALPASPPPDACLGVAADCSPSQIADADLLQWKRDLAAVLVSGDGSVHTARRDQMTEVTVTIRWHDRAAAPAADATGVTVAPAAGSAELVVSSAL